MTERTASDVLPAGLENSIAKEWQPAFRTLVETGDVEDGFLEYLEEDDAARQAVDAALDAEAAKIRGLRTAYEAATTGAAPARDRDALFEPYQTTRPAVGGIGNFLARKMAKHLPTHTLRKELQRRLAQRSDSTAV